MNRLTKTSEKHYTMQSGTNLTFPIQVQKSSIAIQLPGKFYLLNNPCSGNK